MSLQERLPVEDLALGLVTLDPLLFILQFWSGDLTMPDNTQHLSIEQRLMLCDQSERLLLCTGRKVAKTLSLERDFVQIALTHQKKGALDEGMFFTPAQAHMNPVRDRIFSTILQEPLFSEMVAKAPNGNMMMSKGDGYVQFKTGWKWHLRIEGISGTDVNMVGLRCQHIIGDEMAFSVDICHKSRINTALPGCRWKYCGVPNGVRGTPFWRIDQTAEGQMWSRHKIPQFANPLYAPESERRKLIIDHGGEHSHTYITQVLGEWGDEVMSSFPPNTIATYNDREYHLYEWGAGFGEKSNFRDDVLDTLFRNMNYPTSRCVIGWDYGVSPDPAAFALFFEEEPGEWYLRAMFILRGVQFPHQIKFVNQIAARFNIGMVCTDEAIAIQSLDSLTSWQAFDEASRSGNIMWANVNGRIELLDATGEVVLDELGSPIKEYRKKWATDELRNSMVHAREELKYPYHIYLPDETMDPTLIDELRGTVEKRTMGGYTQYLTAKQTEGSKSPDDHRTDALRYAVLSIYSLLGVRASKQRVPFSEYKKVMGWAGGRKGWQAPWSP